VLRYKLKELTIKLTRINYDQEIILIDEADNSTENNIDDQFNKSPVDQTCNECFYRVS